MVFLIDVGKGALAVLLAKTFELVIGFRCWRAGGPGRSLWPVWLGWKGGKAVATGFGMFLGLAWPVGLACFGLFMAVISIFRMCRSPAYWPPSAAAADAALRRRRCYVAVSLVASLMVQGHLRNIERLIAGTEPRRAEGLITCRSL